MNIDFTTLNGGYFTANNQEYFYSEECTYISTKLGNMRCSKIELKMKHTNVDTYSAR